MHRRRLMHPSCYRLEIMYAESKWIATPIPSHHIERMMPVMNAIDSPLLLRLDQKIALYILRVHLLRPADIPFAIGRMLQQLAIGAQVLAGITDGAEGLHYKEPVVLP